MKTKIVLLLLIFSLPFAIQANDHSSEYTIDSDNSSIRILTDRGGALGGFAHFHIISIKNIEGKVSYTDLQNANASFVVRPEEFLVDAPEELALYPDIFTKEVKDNDREGTRKNMLGKKLLNAAKFPAISGNIRLLELNGEDAVFDITLSIHDKEVTVQLPGKLNIENDSLSVQSEFDTSLPELGFKVFKAVLGSVSVGKELKFIVDINASATAKE